MGEVGESTGTVDMLILGGSNGNIWHNFWYRKKEIALSYMYMEH